MTTGLCRLDGHGVHRDERPKCYEGGCSFLHDGLARYLPGDNVFRPEVHRGESDHRTWCRATVIRTRRQPPIEEPEACGLLLQRHCLFGLIRRWWVILSGFVSKASGSCNSRSSRISQSSTEISNGQTDALCSRSRLVQVKRALACLSRTSQKQRILIVWRTHNSEESDFATA